MTDPEVRALTIRQPHASLIAAGVQTIWTSERSTTYRGPLLIHAGSWEMANCVSEYDRDPKAWDALGASPCDCWPRGAVVAVAELVDVVPIWQPYQGRAPLIVVDRDRAFHHPGNRTVNDVTDQLALSDFTPGRWAYLIANVHPIDPTPAKGRQGLWTPDDLLAGLPTEVLR